MNVEAKNWAVAVEVENGAGDRHWEKRGERYESQTAAERAAAGINERIAAGAIYWTHFIGAHRAAVVPADWTYTPGDWTWINETVDEILGGAE